MSREIFEEPQEAESQPLPETGRYKTLEIINSSAMAVQ